MFDTNVTDHHLDALDAGAAYALYRHGQDQQTNQLVNALGTQQQPSSIDVHVHLGDEDDRNAPVINALDFTTVDMPASWNDFIGQEPLKQRLAISMKSAQARDAALDHTLLASGMPGVGKTTMARLIAKTLGVKIIEIVPPFNMFTLVAALESLGDRDICFIDEIHLLMMKRRGGDMLLKILEDKVAYLPDGTVVQLNDITIIGATTDKGLLPKTILDRFKIKPYYQAYSHGELAMIAVDFAAKDHSLAIVNNDLAFDIAGASRGTPRVIEEMIMAARDMSFAINRPPTSQEVLDFVEVEGDGLGREHVHYLTSMRKYFSQVTKDNTVEYIVGEAAIMQILMETKGGNAILERFLIERGMIDRTPRGRRLTARGIARAEALIAQGKGPSDIA